VSGYKANEQSRPSWIQLLFFQLEEGHVTQQTYCTIMVWGTFSVSGTMELQEVQGRQTAAGYVQVLQRASHMTEGHRLCGNDWVFQQDNATVHNARRKRDFFQESNITLLDHPACPPNLKNNEVLSELHIQNICHDAKA
uniref:Tc1-like transposase DDE domain-containing protein n=1 Tax=Haplochromis burtoni TaxID=8153 RepID=A0A3Q2UXP4_HAPBU